MSWIVKVRDPYYYYSQLTEPVWGNYTDVVSNSSLNCGETCVSQVIKHLRDVYIAPSAIKDVILGDKSTGTTTEQMLSNFLLNYANITTNIYYPTEMSNSTNTGLVNLEWSYLYATRPLIALGTLTINGVNYNHWRVIIQQTDTTVTASDPWTGASLTWSSYQNHWNNFKGILIGVNDSRPSDL